MKHLNWKILIVTCFLCVLPVFFRVLFWDRLPDLATLPFDKQSPSESYTPTVLMGFILPVIMVVMQFAFCVISDTYAAKTGRRKRFLTIIKWIIPVVAVILQIAAMLFSMGKEIDLRKSAMLILALGFLVMGNYMPNFENVESKTEEEANRARKINRLIKDFMVIMGTLAMIIIFMPPVYSLVGLFIFIPCGIFYIAYIIKMGRNNEKNS